MQEIPLIMWKLALVKRLIEPPSLDGKIKKKTKTKQNKQKIKSQSLIVTLKLLMEKT